MTDKAVEYVTKTTPDLGREQIERLKQVFPESISEGKVDFDLLQATLGDADALHHSFGKFTQLQFAHMGQSHIFQQGVDLL